jgi:hypothetical protein
MGFASTIKIIRTQNIHHVETGNGHGNSCIHVLIEPQETSRHRFRFTQRSGIRESPKISSCQSKSTNKGSVREREVTQPRIRKP